MSDREMSLELIRNNPALMELVKEARHGLSPLLLAGVYGAATALGTVGVKSIKKLHHRARKSRDFRSMMEAAPSLRDEDPVKVQMAFNTIHNLAPNLAQDPLVASTFVRRTVNTDIGGGGMAVDPATAKMLTDTQSKVEIDPARETATAITKGLGSSIGKADKLLGDPTD